MGCLEVLRYMVTCGFYELGRPIREAITQAAPNTGDGTLNIPKRLKG